MDVTREGLARMVDHTNLRPTARKEDIERLCHEAIEHGFGAVCVHSGRTGLASSLLAGSGVGVCCVAGFPLGANVAEAKAYEARRAVELGATEVDMVMNVGALLEGNEDLVRDDIEMVVHAVRDAGGLVVKVILETGYLDRDRMATACRLVKESGAQFVKTSTGFGPRGASIEDIRLMREAVGPGFGVKAAGGIKTLDFALECVRAGADRLGTSSGVEIIGGFKK